MDKFYPPYFPCYIPLPNGKPAAGGKLYAYYTGTDNLAPLYAEDGTILVGSVADIDSSGQVHVLLDPAITYRLKVVPPVGSQMPDQIYDNVRVANGTIVGMENPMTDQGDMIVGAAAGVPTRLAHPNGIGFLRATLQFGMKVLQWVGLTGTKGIEVTNGTSGTKIGLDTTGASEGDALKIVSGVPTWSTDAEGMQNPMTTTGDLIVGNTDGVPDRLGVGTDGDILATASGSPTWEGGPKKYRNVYQNIPSPNIDDGYLGCLFYLSGSAQSLTLPATANIPSKSFIDFVFLDGTATLTITPQGTTTLNEAAAAVTIGGKSASLYRLVFLGHGGSGDEWAVGGTDTATQPGDHKLLVSATDAAAGYLGAKLTAGANVTLTPQTDGDGVQTLEISATGGGGGGGGSGVSFEPFGTATDDYTKIYRAPQVWSKTILGGLFPPTIQSFSFYHTIVAPSEIPDFKIMCGIYDKNNDLVSPFTWANHSGVASASTRYKFYSVSFDSPVSINPLERYRVLVWYYSSSSADQRFVKATSPQTGPYYGIVTGALPSDPGNTYGVLPATFPSLNNSSMTNSALWISLNPFAGEY